METNTVEKKGRKKSVKGVIKGLQGLVVQVDKDTFPSIHSHLSDALKEAQEQYRKEVEPFLV